MDWICANCGKKIFVREDMIQGLCTDCFKIFNKPNTFDNLPRINICSICYSFKSRDKWLKSKSENFESALEESIPYIITKALSSERGNYDYKIITHPENMSEESKAVFKIPITIITKKFNNEGNIIINQDESNVIVEMNVCDKCTKIGRGSYEAIIQIRAKKRKIEDYEKDDILNFIMEKLDESYFAKSRKVISNIKEIKSGIDIYLISSKIAKSLSNDLVNEFGFQIKESKKLAGKDKSGKTRYRTAFSLRLPLFRIGDIINDNDKFYLINDIDNKKVIVTDIIDNNRLSFSISEAWKYETVIPKEYLERFVILAIEEDLVNIMDMISYETMILNKPKWDLKQGREILGLRIEDKKIILIPESESDF